MLIYFFLTWAEAGAKYAAALFKKNASKKLKQILLKIEFFKEKIAKMPKKKHKKFAQIISISATTIT